MARKSLKSVMRLIETAKEEVPAEKAFLKDLERSIELTSVKGNRLPSKTYKPSGMNCMRASYYQIMGKEPETDDTTYTSVGICNSGSDIHERIQQAVLDMKDNGIDCEYVNVAEFVRSRELDYLDIVKEPDFEKGEYETKLYHKDLNISFLCDGIIKYNNHYYILELKTESTNKFWQRSDTDPNHYKQATAYSLALQLDEVLFVYICRDNLDMKSYMFKPTSDMKNDLVGYIDECNSYLSRQVAPPKPEPLNKKACMYCGYKQYCKEDN